jgi:hypothetical protein
MQSRLHIRAGNDVNVDPGERPKMSVMFPRFFGVPQGAIRLGKMRELSGFATRLYVALCHESERYSTRELTRTVAQLQALVDGSRNSHAKARSELIRAGLVQAEPFGTEGFIFHLCDPETGAPWPLHPQERALYQPKNGSAAVMVQDGASHAKPRKPPKIDCAGVSFQFGANASEQDGPVQPVTSEAPAEVVHQLRWDELGDGEEQSQPQWRRRK